MDLDISSLPECSLTWSSSTKGMSSLLQNFPWSPWPGIANQGHSVTQRSPWPMSPESLSHWAAPLTSVSAQSCNYSWGKMLSAQSWCSGLLRYILAVPTSGWNLTVSCPWREWYEFYHFVPFPWESSQEYFFSGLATNMFKRCFLGSSTAMQIST